MRLYLVGMPGSGKSYLGKQMALLKNLTFIDLDEQIASKAHLSVAEIFTQKGEDEFRKLETEALRETVDFPDAIIATGGGAPCFHNNMQWINENGSSIYFKASPVTLAERLWPMRFKRPLLTGIKTHEELIAFVERTLAQREKFYEQADHTINIVELLLSQEFEELLNRIFNNP